ncbi:type VI secretion system protein TssA [Paraburkholderia humisilvae]|uniref:ImpA N-terminal domain-containing protein n=1 Tax=Paraburkholderia humisilvae TaxID=627669 RepID=A0A6J5EYS6_9BURK|nr:type VI secretion system protein TssA [Paraburkholderia humisilvae]CAB3770186.1 hypothetical protein LMG29542_06293 [Paraburkholderia humisilvae]
MSTPLDFAKDFFATRYGLDGAALFAPIEPDEPAGRLLRGTPEWLAIRRARECDDSTLPLGAWVRDLKHAAWDQVAAATLDALANRSKDLQLAIWLVEALLHEHGFAGLAAGVAVLDALTARYWDLAYPQPAGNDVEHRANLFRWLNDKLVVPAKLVPITAPDGEGRAYSWADCERTRLRERVAAGSQNERERGSDGDPDDDRDAAGFMRAVRATPDDAWQCLHADLEQAGEALLDLGVTLDRLFGDDAPGVGALRNQIEQIEAFVAAELRQRGVTIQADETAADTAAIGYESGSAHRVDYGNARDDADDAGGQYGQSYADARLAGGAPLSRARAYAQLAAAAAELVRLEPHSPVPYLIQRAIEWGQLNTTQLYEEVFIKRQGQLNIFELVGLTVERTENA